MERTRIVTIHPNPAWYPQVDYRSIDQIPKEYEVIQVIQRGGSSNLTVLLIRLKDNDIQQIKKMIEQIELRVRALSDKIMYDGAMERRSE